MKGREVKLGIVMEIINVGVDGGCTSYAGELCM